MNNNSQGDYGEHRINITNMRCYSICYWLLMTIIMKWTYWQLCSISNQQNINIVKTIQDTCLSSLFLEEIIWKNYHTEVTVPKSNQPIVEIERKPIPLCCKRLRRVPISKRTIGILKEQKLWRHKPCEHQKG